jgi:phenylalanyl-tRNA synthetase beta chain
MKQEDKNTHHYSVTIPSYRLDIKNQEDLVEEIAKVHGYENIPGSFPLFQQKKIVIDKNQIYRGLIRQKLSSLGYQEIITYSLVSAEEKNDFCSLNREKFYQLLAPKSENHVYYRRSLLSSHLKAITYNLTHQNKNLFFFEISKIYFLTSGDAGEEILALSGTGKVMSDPVHKLEHNYDFF